MIVPPQHPAGDDRRDAGGQRVDDLDLIGEREGVDGVDDDLANVGF